MIVRIPQDLLRPSRSTGRPAFTGTTAAASASGDFRGVWGPAAGGMGFHRLHGNECIPMTAADSMNGTVIKPRPGLAAGGDPGG